MIISNWWRVKRPRRHGRRWRPVRSIQVTIPIRSSRVAGVPSTSPDTTEDARYGDLSPTPRWPRTLSPAEEPRNPAASFSMSYRQRRLRRPS